MKKQIAIGIAVSFVGLMGCGKAHFEESTPDSKSTKSQRHEVSYLYSTDENKGTLKYRIYDHPGGAYSATELKLAREHTWRSVFNERLSVFLPGVESNATFLPKQKIEFRDESAGGGRMTFPIHTSSLRLKKIEHVNRPDGDSDFQLTVEGEPLVDGETLELRLQNTGILTLNVRIKDGLIVVPDSFGSRELILGIGTRLTLKRCNDVTPTKQQFGDTEVLLHVSSCFVEQTTVKKVEEIAGRPRFEIKLVPSGR